MNLETLQREQNEWQKQNFPNTKKHQCLLGVVEELGELAQVMVPLGILCHSHLKYEQDIRGNSERHRGLAKDAIGDIVVFLSGYCNSNGFDLAECVEATWSEVKKRDWSKKGRTPEIKEENSDDRTTAQKLH